jgi:predicted esterase
MLFLTSGRGAMAEDPPALAGQEGLFTLPGELRGELPPGRMFDYALNLNQEKFYLYVPPNYRGRERFGLIAFLHSGDAMNVPKDWKNVLTRYKLLYVAPQKVGNEQPIPRRALVVVAAIRKMMELYKVDPQRVYITGVSGGAKVASMVAFLQPDIIRGTLPMCGFVFPQDEDMNQELFEKAKSQVRFALITGSKDFNRQFIVHFYNMLESDKYQAKLFDVPGMGHQIARGQTLNAALKWIEDRGATSNANPHAKSQKSSLAKKTSDE